MVGIIIISISFVIACVSAFALGCVTGEWLANKKDKSEK